MKSLIATITAGAFLSAVSILPAQQPSRPYRLSSVDLKQTVIWGTECRAPDGSGLAFGGQDQDSEDGRPHTRILVEGSWIAIHEQLRQTNPLQSLHDRVSALRNIAKNTLAITRHVYFQGHPLDTETETLRREVLPAMNELNASLTKLDAELQQESDDKYAAIQKRFARLQIGEIRRNLPDVSGGVTAESLARLHEVQIGLEIVAEAFDAEPPARAMNCGTARLPNDESGPESNTLVYDATTKLYLLFGGDHLDYLTNDTWVFDPSQRRWFQRHPAGAPPPRANHRLQADGNGTVQLTGGYSYTSSTGYTSGQYADLNDGQWSYDIAKNKWSGGRLVAADSRIYRSDAFHPNFYTSGTKPNATEFQAWLAKLPANEWMATDPPHLPRLNRDWGTARIDPSRDLMLRWSGGHSAHGGTDVLHYHFATNRWELPFPVEFPLGQLYSNTSYPNGFNFNRRPWITGHTYQNYDYDPPSRLMVKAGRPRHHYLYDPNLGDWIGRGEKPEAMQYNSCFYTLTLVATPHGVICWDRYGKVHRFDHTANDWKQLELTGDVLPGAYVDNSSVVYDSNRDRLLAINTPGYGKPFDGVVWEIDLKQRKVTGLAPDGREQAHRFANIDKSCFDPVNDLLLLGTYLTDQRERTPTPAYDCARNRWVTLDLEYGTGKRFGNTTRAFPHSRSDGLIFDSARKLIWGTNTNGQVYVLRLDMEKASVQPLD